MQLIEVKISQISLSLKNKRCSSLYNDLIFGETTLTRRGIERILNTYSFLLLLRRCLIEKEFACRSATFDRRSLLCFLTEYSAVKIPNNLKDDEDYDYMENECLMGKHTVVLQIKNQR